MTYFSGVKFLIISNSGNGNSIYITEDKYENGNALVFILAPLVKVIFSEIEI